MRFYFTFPKYRLPKSNFFDKFFLSNKSIFGKQITNKKVIFSPHPNLLLRGEGEFPLLSGEDQGEVLQVLCIFHDPADFSENNFHHSHCRNCEKHTDRSHQISTNDKSNENYDGMYAHTFSHNYW